MARVPRPGPRREAQHELALTDRAHLVPLAGSEVDQARAGECPLTGARADVQIASHEEDEGVLVDLVLL